MGTSHDSPPRSFAIIPAAGESRRMGRPKLLLPWGDRNVIETVIHAWQRSNVTHIIAVVAKDDDSPLAGTCRRTEIEVEEVSPRPVDMKASIAAGMARILLDHDPQTNDACLIAPADIPQLSVTVINALLAAHDPQRPQPISPVFEGRQGHPLLLPWPLAAEVAQLGPNEGVRTLLEGHPPRLLEVDDPDVVAPDLDTPETYRRLHDQHQRKNR
jgi:molybdenum cofactor cytidylyltransferase